MQNEPNLKKTKMNVNSLSKMGCVISHPLQRRKNEPNFTRYKFYLQITDAANREKSNGKNKIYGEQT